LLDRFFNLAIEFSRHGRAKNRALKSIFKGGAIVFLGIAISKIFSLVFRVIVGRYLGPTEYGIIMLMTAVFSTAAGLSTIGVPLGVQKYVAYYRSQNKPEKIRGTIRTGLKIVTIPSTIIGATLFIFAPWISNNFFGQPKAIIPIRLIAIVIPLRAWHDVLTNVTDAFERMQYEVYVERIYSSTVKVSLTAALVLLGYNYLGAAFGFAFALGSSVILSIYFATQTFEGIFSRKYPAQENYSEIFHHSWPLFGGSLIGILAGNIDSFSIEYFLSSADLGIYQAAYPFAALLLIGKDMFSSIFLSNASKVSSGGEYEQLAELYRTLTKWISIVSIPIFLFMFAFPRAFLTVYGAEYFSGQMILRILSVGFLFSAIIGPASNVYQAVGRTKLVLVTSAIIGVLNILLNIALVPIYGSTGAAIATTIAFISVGLVNIIILWRIIGKNPFKTSTMKVWISGFLSISIAYFITNTMFEKASMWFLAIALVLLGFSTLFCFCFLRL